MLPLTALAEPPTVKRVRLASGVKAPFAGTLITDQALASLITRAAKQLELCGAKSHRQRKDHAVESLAAKKLCEARLLTKDLRYSACRDDMSRRVKLYKKELQQCQKPTPFYKTSIFGFVAGQVVAGALCVGATRLK